MMRFVERPIDLKALEAVLNELARSPSESEARFIVMELQVLVDEAFRAFDRGPWEDRIIGRWKALEDVLRQGSA